MSLLLLLGNAFTGVLDSLGLTVSVGYSFRRLTNRYIGNCCNVRRSSDSSAIDIPFDGQGNFSQSTYESFCGTNLLDKEEFDNFSVSGGVIVSSNATTNHLGESIATKLYAVSGGTRYAYQANTYLSGVKYTLSCYMKAAEKTWGILSTAGSKAGGASFDLQNGITGVAIGAITPRIESVGSGWYRCSITFLGGATGIDPYIVAMIGEANNDDVVTTGGTDGIYIYGMQLEYGGSAEVYESRRNLILLPPTSWSVSGSATIAAAPSVADALGGTNSYLFSETSSSGDRAIVCSAASNSMHATVYSGGVYTASVYVKPTGTDELLMTLESGTGGANSRFNFTSGGSAADGGTYGSGGPSSLSRSITSIGDGWWRIAVTATMNTTNINMILNFYATTADSDVSNNYCYISNPQVERNPAASTWQATNKNAASSGYIATWYEQSGGYNATQGTQASQPQLVPRQHGERPAVYFDGFDDYLVATDPNTLDVGLGAFSVYSVFSFRNATYQVMCGKTGNAVGGHFRCFATSSRQIALWRGQDGEPYNANSSAITLNARTSGFWGRDPTVPESQAAKDGSITRNSETVAHSWSNSTNFYIGNDVNLNYPWFGIINEIVILPSATTTALLAAITDSHQDYWGTP